MVATRKLCRLLYGHLGVDVVPHAARLMRTMLIAPQVMKKIEERHSAQTQ